MGDCLIEGRLIMFGSSESCYPGILESFKTLLRYAKTHVLLERPEKNISVALVFSTQDSFLTERLSSSGIRCKFSAHAI